LDEGPQAWDKPFVSARAGRAFSSEADLIVAAIQHVRDGKSEDTSPAIAEWYKYLGQVEGYEAMSAPSKSNTDTTCRGR
jgi:hypothetical protein